MEETWPPGHKLADVGDVDDALPEDHVLGEGRHGHRNIVNALLAPGRGDQDFLQIQALRRIIVILCQCDRV
jgi:hypothetical protein